MITLGVTALKCLAAGLIVLPEPSTTIAGVALLGVAHFLYKRQNLINRNGVSRDEKNGWVKRS